MEEFREEMQAVVNSMVVDFNKEIKALQMTEPANKWELQACRAEVEAYE